MTPVLLVACVMGPQESTLVDDLPQSVVETLAGTLPSILGQTAASIASVFALIEGITGIEEVQA